MALWPIRLSAPLGIGKLTHRVGNDRRVRNAARRLVSARACANIPRADQKNVGIDSMRQATRLFIVLAIGTMAIGDCLCSAGARAAGEPLSIARQGNFYIGGQYVDDHGDMPMIGQAFVEFQIPQRQTHPYPIVLVHGGSQTGTGWISTPDGREGWAIYLLRRGYAVYIVDQVGRGRSAYIADVYGASRTQTREYVMQRFSTSEKFNLWPQARLHTQWPGTGEPGDPVFDNYFASNVPSMENREIQSRQNNC